MPILGGRQHPLEVSHRQVEEVKESHPNPPTRNLSHLIYQRQPQTTQWTQMGPTTNNKQAGETPANNEFQKAGASRAPI